MGSYKLKTLSSSSSSFFLLSLIAVLLSGCDRQTLYVYNQSPMDWNSLRGQWVFINYWAEWCGPCVEEIPELNELNKRIDSVIVLGVNFDGVDKDELTRLKGVFNIEFPMLLTDPSEMLGAKRPQVLPTTLLFDPNGQFVKALIGPQTVDSLSRLIE